MHGVLRGSRQRRGCRSAVEPDRRDDPRHLDMVGARGREVDECNVLGGGRYRVRFPAGAFGTRIECALVRGETYLFRVEVAEGQTLTAGVSSVEDNAVFAISSPSGALLAEEQTELVVSGTDAGSYEIVVGSIRATPRSRSRSTFADERAAPRFGCGRSADRADPGERSGPARYQRRAHGRARHV